jgi:hypothetical protein
MSDSPRTDDILREFQPADTARELDLARLARQLERELSAKCAELERVKGERDECRAASEGISRIADHHRERATTAEAALARANACINAFNRYFDDDDKTLLDDIRREHAEAIKDAAIDAARTK